LIPLDSTSNLEVLVRPDEFCGNGHNASDAAAFSHLASEDRGDEMNV
jgi:hypothetical protein